MTEWGLCRGRVLYIEYLTLVKQLTFCIRGRPPQEFVVDCLKFVQSAQTVKKNDNFIMQLIHKSMHSTHRNQNRISTTLSFITVLTVVFADSKKGAYPENSHMLCIARLN